MKTNIDQICRQLAETKNPNEIKLFLGSLLTPAELTDLDSRWELAKRLLRGDTQRKIAKDLHLGLCKITRGSKELKKPNSVLKNAISKTENQ